MYSKITLTLRHFTQSLRLMVGMPEYSTYVDHMKSTHPDRAIMTYEEFFISHDGPIRVSAFHMIDIRAVFRHPDH